MYKPKASILKGMIKASHTRSVAKGITWRVIAATTTMTVVYFFTEDLKLVASVGALESSAKIALYYLHERAWLQVNWGWSLK